jgi:putative solute:sodium symporter small subunit
MAALPGADALRRRWHAGLRLTGVLLVLWFGVSFGIAFFARDLDFNLFGWPFSFWVGSQGALIVYLALVGIYARRARQLDDAASIGEDD